ncbi:MAG TPA: anthranilate phosphoribosyltransferase [Acidimicrobiales bacterium]
MSVTLDELGGWRAILLQLTSGRDLTADEGHAAMTEILAGRATDAQIAAYIVALRMKGEAVEEVSGMVDAMLEASDPITLPPEAADAVDIVGTGGGASRQSHALNVSTMAAFVVAGAGAYVCKHGNRKATSTSGSFDFLEAIGVSIDLDGAGVARCVAEAHAGFCFARAFHPAMRHAGPVRAELGIPTLFNFIGPLSNPARVTRQVIGVNDPAMATTVVGVLLRRGAQRAMVVHGHDGMDELTVTGRSTVWEVRDGDVAQYDLDPRSLGIEVVDLDQIAGGDAATNAAISERIFAGEAGPHRDIVTLNAAAGLVVAGVADDLAAGLALAQASIDDGKAAAAVTRLVEVSAGG